MRALVLVAALVLCACSAPTSITACSIDKLVTGDVGLVSFVDCGSFDHASPNYTDVAMTAAQLCVLNAVSRNQGFYLAYDASVDGSTTELRGGYSGVPNLAGTALEIRAYAGQGTAGESSLKLVSSRKCATLVASDQCSPAVGVPCLTCAGPDTGSIVCRH